MDIEFNKIAGAVLGAAVFSMGLGIFSEIVFETEKPAKPGFVIATAEAKPEAGGAAESAAIAVAPIADRLKTATVDDGKKVFAKCTSCHNADNGGKNSTGPNLWGVVNRVVGSHDGFAYSAGFQERDKAGQKWTYDDLDHFLANPAAYQKGTKMSFAGLKKPEERAAVIMFLHGQAATPEPLP